MSAMTPRPSFPHDLPPFGAALGLGIILALSILFAATLYLFCR